MRKNGLHLKGRQLTTVLDFFICFVNVFLVDFNAVSTVNKNIISSWAVHFKEIMPYEHINYMKFDVLMYYLLRPLPVP